MRRLFVFGLVALLTAPLLAQHQSDPDKKHHNLNVHVEGFAVKTR